MEEPVTVTTTTTTTTSTREEPPKGFEQKRAERPYIFDDDTAAVAIRKLHYANYATYLLGKPERDVVFEPRRNHKLSLRGELWSYILPDNGYGFFENGGSGVCDSTVICVKIDREYATHESAITGDQQRIFDGIAIPQAGATVPITLRCFRFNQFQVRLNRTLCDHHIQCLVGIECEKYMRTLAFVDKLTNAFNVAVAEIGGDVKYPTITTTHGKCNLFKFLYPYTVNGKHVATELCAIVEKNIKLDGYNLKEEQAQSNLDDYSSDTSDGRRLLIARQGNFAREKYLSYLLESFSHYSLIETGYTLIVTDLFGVYNQTKNEFTITSPKVIFLCVCVC